jgi:hypothetical protein
MDQYRAIVSSSCSIEGAKKVGEIDFPFFEKERLDTDQRINPIFANGIFGKRFFNSKFRIVFQVKFF